MNAEKTQTKGKETRNDGENGDKANRSRIKEVLCQHKKALLIKFDTKSKQTNKQFKFFSIYLCRSICTR